jgi:hypothetical protein
MGTRGPLPGKGGKPTANEQARRKSRRPVPESTIRREMLADFDQLTRDGLRELCGEWRPLEPQDEIALAAFWELLQRYRSMVVRLRDIPVEEWGTGEGKTLNIQLRGCGEQLLSWCKNFGMTPADRARLGEAAPAPEGASVFSAMVDRAESILKN